MPTLVIDAELFDFNKAVIPQDFSVRLTIMRIIDNITVNIIDECKGFGIVLCQYFPLIICLCYQPKYHFSLFSGRLFYMVSEKCPLSAQELGYRTQA